MPITVEALTLEVAKAIEPLRVRLVGGEIVELFEELGLPASTTVLGAAGVRTRLAAAATEAGRLPAVIDDLSAAIEADDVVAIVGALGRAAPIVRAVVSAVDEIGTAVNTAAASTGAARTEVEAFAAQLPERLIGYVVATYLEASHAVIGGVGGLLGIVENTPVAATAHAPAYVRRALHFDRIAPLLEDPTAALATEYGWGGATLEWDRLLRRLAPFASRMSGFAFVQPGAAGQPSVLRIGFVDIGPTDDPVPGLRAGLRTELGEPLDATIPIRDGVAVEIGVATAVEASAAIELHPPAQLEIVPPTTEVSGQARIGVSVSGTGGRPVQLIGIAGGTRLEAAKLRVSTGADLAWDIADGRAFGSFIIEGAIEDGRLVISLAGADGFLSAILPEGGIGVDFDVLAGWSSEKGLYFDGGAALAVDIPVDLDLGPIRIQMLHLQLGLGGEALTLEASGAISARLGPFAMAVDRMGTIARVTFDQPNGNLGPANLVFEFKPPSGIGLSLDAGVVKGGGYLFIDQAAGQYAGVLELAFGPVSIKAIGILSTKLPGGAQGWALLLLVFGEFPAVQLGFGFTLNGVGGIIGLQHGVSIQALQDGLRTGVLDSVLFPRDPVANAPTLIAQLRVVFPIVPRALTLGPALKIGWSTPPLVTLSLGLVLQFDDVLGSGPGQPALSRVVLVGQLKVQVPPVDELGIDAPALIHLQIDVVGAYDVREQALSIDAVLRDSHVALLPITGSLVVRARFGDDPTFVLAVGGFHPRFTDLPPGIPPQTRVGIQLQYGIATVRIVGYFAITSNSVQTGAEASLLVAGGGFRVEAFVGFDALFVFEPVFRFEIDFRIGAAIKYKSISLAAVRLDGRLIGPGRWEVSGSATIELLFFDVGIDFEVGWGDAPAPALPRVAVGPQIKAALELPASWTAQLPAGGAALVSLRGVDGGTDVLAHPLGEVAGIQKIVPLGIRIDRVGRSRPSDGDTFTITRIEIGGDEQPIVLRDEHFARGEFLDLSEEEKLSRPSFERFPAGVVASTADFEVPTTQVAFEPVWETFFLRQERPSVRGVLDPSMLVLHASFGAVARSELRATDRLLPAVKVDISVADAEYTLTTVSSPGAPVSGTVATTFTKASQAAEGDGLLVTDVAELVADR
jgi:hypothetical protein